MCAVRRENSTEYGPRLLYGKFNSLCFLFQGLSLHFRQIRPIINLDGKLGNDSKAILRSLAASRGVLGGLRAVLGRSWGSLGSFWGRAWDSFANLWASSGSIGISWNGLGFPSYDSRAHTATSPDGVMYVAF